MEKTWQKTSTPGDRHALNGQSSAQVEGDSLISGVVPGSSFSIGPSLPESA
jgi:hypothetical protein